MQCKPGTIVLWPTQIRSHANPYTKTNNKMNKTKGRKIDPKTVGGEEFVILLIFCKNIKQNQNYLKNFERSASRYCLLWFLEKMGILQLMISL